MRLPVTQTTALLVLTVALAAAESPQPQPSADRPGESGGDVTVKESTVPAARLDLSQAALETGQPATKPRLSPWTAEVVKLTTSGIEDAVVLTFIENAGMFNLGAEQIVYLRDRGVSGLVIQAMLQHDHDVATGERRLTITSEPARASYVQVLRPAKENASAARQSLISQVAGADETALAASAATTGMATATRMETERLPTVTSEPPRPPAPVTSPAARPAVLSSRSPGDRQKVTYRVLKPYPVELLPPIVFLNTAEPEPNLLILEVFPPATAEPQ